MTLPEMNIFLLVGGVLSLIASALHLGVIVGGPDWLRFFGAGEQMAQMAENGSWYPGVVTGLIAVVLMVLGTYALVGATGGTQALFLPLVKWVLLVTTAVYLLRGLAVIPIYFMVPEQMNAFVVWSSLIVLGYGIVHAIGLLQVWRLL
ncbi:hypothetical protein MNBD_ALPHA06-852 [hydrothermal vent metagenome]|uniref:Uncharacterized protein n=1 Tax=hydrothermal vent metagenome TaxID=652676 RepID=A0A3B0R8W6_9ZZZZ